MYQYFIWNGVSSLDMGVVMLKAPSIFIPQRKVNEIKISGRNGVLHEDEKTYQNYTKDAECHVMDRSQIDEVCAWLTGFGEVIFSSEPDKVYRAYIKNQIEFGSILKNINDFLVQFDVEPFKYSVNRDDETLTFETETCLYNKGTFTSEPILKIYATGNITLHINEDAFVLNSIDEYVVVNSELQEVYKGKESKNNYFYAEKFPTLKVGENNISWKGNVEKIEIQPNWRWL